MTRVECSVDLRRYFADLAIASFAVCNEIGYQVHRIAGAWSLRPQAPLGAEPVQTHGMTFSRPQSDLAAWAWDMADEGASDEWIRWQIREQRRRSA